MPQLFTTSIGRGLLAPRKRQLDPDIMAYGLDPEQNAS